MLSSLKEQGKLGSARLIGIVKEVAPTSSASTDEKLGVGEFASKYFANGQLYLDSNQTFWKALGSRPLKFGTWNPFKIWSLIKDMQEKMKAKGIDGNLRGDARLLGGVMVVGKGGPVTFVSLEQMGSPFCVDDLVQAVTQTTTQ
mmetsp:Transcript_8925/g.17831  ORF Transcript_8925/g.17831 Transcript_8925/m.17831 type:complete len:144 (+) Transcript_8925:429-860(+)